MNRMLLVLGAALLATTACTDTNSGEGEAARAGSVTATHYTDATELFVEYRLLAAGKQRRFDAHLTWLDTDKPVNEGELTVELVHSNGRIDRGAGKVSDTPGIFRVLVKPSKAGPARLRFMLAARGQTITHELGPVTVYPSSEAAAKATPPHAENPDRIAFSKEVQWKIPFDTAVAAVRQLDDSIPVAVDVKLAPDAEAIVSAPVAGVIRTGARVPAPGMPVGRGQTLATISAQLGGGEDVATLDLNISEARIAVEAARREVSRMSGLYRAEAVPQRRLQDAQTQLRLAQAQLAAAQRRRAALGGGGPGVPLVSPISGQILSSTLVRGAAVEAGAELMRIGDPRALWLVAHVPESHAPRVSTPTGIDIVRGTGSATFFTGRGVRLVQAGGLVDERTRTMDVIFAGPILGLRPGQRVQGRLRTGTTASQLAIPISAVINEGGQNVVYVQVEGEAFERRPVQLGLRSGDLVAIEGDLKAGERVVTEGAAAVRAAAATPGAFGHGHAH
jgi:cobalt-zinc-cadmium efflux system membrane fusion protein